MNRTHRALLTVSLLIAPVWIGAQSPATTSTATTTATTSDGGLDPAAIHKPLADQWTTYSGDYSGRRFSALTHVNRETVKGLSLGWVSRLTGGLPGAAGGGGRGFGGRGGGGGGARVIVGGKGPEELAYSATPNVKGSILQVNNILYVTAPDNVWAIDAETGQEIWRYFWKTRGGTHIGNRGAGMWKNYLFFETPDNYLVSLDARTGQERWAVEIADFNLEYFSTVAPVIVDNHVLVGTGNDIDSPGFLQSFDPETGKLQWKLYTVPMNIGDPGLDTWPNLNAARHGGAQTWIPGAYDPETKLYIIGTGNPTPGYTGAGRKGDNLFSCSLVAVNVDTGKMAWYYQTSPHDTHDWDSAQTPVLIDGVIDGKQRKLVSTAERNGYFFTLDRVTGEHIITAKYGSTTNWARSVRPNGVVEPDPLKEATIPGSLVSPVESGVTNWPPPAYSPDTGLFYVPEHNGFNILYLTDPDPRGSMGLGGKSVAGVGSAGDFLTAIDYKTGRIAWRKPISGGGVGAGLLATAGGLLFGSDGSGNLMALDSRDGKPLWHTRIGNASNAPQTYLLDGRQHLLTAVGDTLYAFTLY